MSLRPLLLLLALLAASTGLAQERTLRWGAASDLYAPVACEVIESNTALDGAPDLVNREPYAGAWMIRVRLADPSSVSGLLDAAAYAAVL